MTELTRLRKESTERSLSVATTRNASHADSSQNETDTRTASFIETDQLPDLDELVDYLVCIIAVLVSPDSYEFSD
jgi:hypothetical protein